MFFRSYGTNNGLNNPIILNSHFFDISEKNLFKLCVCVRVCVCVCVCIIQMYIPIIINMCVGA